MLNKQTWEDYLYKLIFTDTYQSHIRRRIKVLLNCAFCRSIHQTKILTPYSFCVCCLCSQMTERRGVGLGASFDAEWSRYFRSFLSSRSQSWISWLCLFKINDQKITRYPLKLVKILTKAKWGNHTARKLIFLSWKNWNIKYLKNMAAKIRLQWNILTPINWLLDLLINYMVNQIISTFLGNSSKMVSNAMLQCF